MPKVANGPGGTNWGSRVGIRKPCFTFRGGCRRVLDTKTAGPTQGHIKQTTPHSACAGIKENACGQLLAVSESRGSGPGPHTSLLAHPFGIVANPNFNERCRRGTIQGHNRTPQAHIHSLSLTKTSTRDNNSNQGVLPARGTTFLSCRSRSASEENCHCIPRPNYTEELRLHELGDGLQHVKSARTKNQAQIVTQGRRGTGKHWRQNISFNRKLTIHIPQT